MPTPSMAVTTAGRPAPRRGRAPPRGGPVRRSWGGPRGVGDCGVPGAPQPGDCAPVGRRAPHVDVDVPAGEPAGGAPQEGAGWAEPHVGCAPGAGAGAG